MELTQRQILMDAGVDVDEPANDQLLSLGGRSQGQDRSHSRWQ